MAAKTVPNYVFQIPGAPSLTESQKTWYLELGIDRINTFKKKRKKKQNIITIIILITCYQKVQIQDF